MEIGDCYSCNLVLATMNISVLMALAVVLVLLPGSLACTRSCCNYCNMTFVFEADCSTTFQGLNTAAQTTAEFEETFESSSPPVVIEAVHTTVRYGYDCCCLAPFSTACTSSTARTGSALSAHFLQHVLPAGMEVL